MPKYLIDANLPYYFSIWNTPEFVHQKDIDDEWTDEQIWEYAINHDMTIITKDSDFSHKMIFRQPPPKVIHIRLGNIRMKEFYQIISSVWNDIVDASNNSKLVSVYSDRIETVFNS